MGHKRSWKRFKTLSLSCYSLELKKPVSFPTATKLKSFAPSITTREGNISCTTPLIGAGTSAST